MRKSPRQIVRNIIEECDIILEIVDSRFYKKTRLRDVEDLIKKKRKSLVIVFSKSDLISKEEKNTISGKFRSTPYVFVSTKLRSGKLKLLRLIYSMSSWPKLRVGVIGYPNAGKSSLINYLSGRGSARTSSMPNFTKGTQWISVSKRLLLYDTPGVVFEKQTDEALALKGAMDADLVKDPDIIALKIISNTNAKEFYDLKEEDPEKALEELCKKRGRLKKGGSLDITAISKIVIRDFQKGLFR